MGNPDLDSSAVRLVNASVVFSGRTALDGVSLILTRGVTAIIGLNGAGKSTLLDVIAGFRKLDSGTLSSVGDGMIVSYLPQSAPLPERSNVNDVVAQALWLRGWPSNEMDRRINKVLAEWELEEFARRRIAELSGGTRQRVAFAVATASDPEVLLLDEPTVGLDAEHRRLVTSLIATQRKRITVITSHVASDIESVCDRVILLAKGVIRFDGTVPDLIEKSDGRTIDDAIISLSVTQ